MRYCSFPKIPGLPISALGFGCMRLPTVGGDPARIDEEAAARLVHQAIDAGVNYFDTAWPYHGQQSEPFLGRAVAGRRHQVQLATKLPVWGVEKESDWERFIDQQLAGWQPTGSISTCCTAWRPSPGTRSRICAAWLLWNAPRLTVASGTSAFPFMARLIVSAPSSTRSTGNSASSSSTTSTSSTRLASMDCATPKATRWAWW